MLSLEDIALRIKNPHLTKVADQEDFKLLAARYPYTQIFSILYLKSLKEGNDVRFEEELRNHSFRITDRVQLYQLMNEPRDDWKASAIKPATDSPVHVKNNSDVEDENTASLSTSEEEINERIDSRNLEALHEHPNEQEQSETETPVKEAMNRVLSEEFEDTQEDVRIADEQSRTAKIEEQDQLEKDRLPLQEKEESDVTDPISELAKQKQRDAVDENIVQHVLSANYQLEKLTPEELHALKERSTEGEESDNSEINKDKITNPSSISASDQLSFSDWLDANESDQTQFSPTESHQTKAPMFEEFDDRSDLFGEVEKPKKEFFSANKKAKESLNELELPVSETLAKIYEMQGNYPKAIEAYKQLCLTIPEKRTFFASLIEKLTKKLNIE